MHSSVRRICSIAAMLFLVLAFTSIGWASTWKVGDIVVCFGGGTCKVLSGSAPATVLDTLSDSGSVTNPGDTRGIAINNTLHVLVTDAGTGGKSNVLEYQILGEDANGQAVPHGVATVFNSTGVGGILAIALNKAGHMFILNANGSNPQIVELDQGGSHVATTQ